MLKTYKVGDLVTIKSHPEGKCLANYCAYAILDMLVKKGQTVKIDYVSTSTKWYCIEGDLHAYSACMFEETTDTLFKPGDRIYYLQEDGIKVFGTFKEYELASFSSEDVVWAYFEHEGKLNSAATWMGKKKCFKDESFTIEKIEFSSIESHDEGGEKQMAQTKFEVGDKVRIIADTSCHSLKIGNTYKITSIYETNADWKLVKYTTEIGCYIKMADAELVSAKNGMTLKELTKGQKASLSKGDQALLRAGYIDDSLTLTDAGIKYLRDMVFQNNKTKMEAAVIVEVEEAETEAKKKKA